MYQKKNQDRNTYLLLSVIGGCIAYDTNNSVSRLYETLNYFSAFYNHVRLPKNPP